MKFNISEFKQTFHLVSLQAIASEIDINDKNYLESQLFQVFLKALRAELNLYDLIDIDDHTKKTITFFVKGSLDWSLAGDNVHDAICNTVERVIKTQNSFFNDSVESIENNIKMDIDVSGELTREDLETAIECESCYISVLNTRIKETVLTKYPDIG